MFVLTRLQQQMQSFLNQSPGDALLENPASTLWRAPHDLYPHSMQKQIIRRIHRDLNKIKYRVWITENNLLFFYFRYVFL